MKTRPRGLPLRIPHSWWRWLRLPGRFHVRKPASFWPWRIWRLALRHAPALTRRQKIVRFARWGVAHTTAIHYAEVRPIPQVTRGRLPRLPFTTDCSGFVTMAYQYAGCPDPSGAGYDGGVGKNGPEYTGTLLAHAEKTGTVLTDVAKAKPGDLIVYGPGSGEHVAVIVEAGPDPLTVSHGQESEPAYVRVSQDGREPQRICRYLP